MKYRLTKKDVDAARAFYRTGFLNWEDAMEFLKDIYVSSNEVINEE